MNLWTIGRCPRLTMTPPQTRFLRCRGPLSRCPDQHQRCLRYRDSNAFSIGSTVLPVTFGLLRLSAVTIPTITIVLLAAAMVVYVALLICVWRASRLRELQYRPNMLTLKGNSEVAPGDVLRRWVASEYVVSTELNRPLLQRKGLWVGRAVTALYAEGLFLSAAAIATLF